jgi:hypothetical protein
MADENDKPTSETPAESKPSEALPIVESPSISPAAPVQEPVAAETPEPTAREAAKAGLTFPTSPRFAMVAAACIVLAAALGGVFGGLAIGAVPKDNTAVHEREAMQRWLAQLTKEIAGLKSELAAADKNARAQTARVTELGAALKEKLARDQSIVTGSIAAPASAPVATPPAALPATPAQAAPLPPPRPAIQEASNRPRDGIAEGWTVLGARRGFVYVQSGRDVYRVVPGDRLPGLGIVEDVRRDELGWVVVTRRGVIVAARERF